MDRKVSRNNYKVYAGNRKRKRERRIFYLVCLILCCLLSFSCGKIVGKAQKKARNGLQPLDRTQCEKDGMDKEGAERSGGSAPDAEAAGILILVNREHPLPEDYTVELVTFQNGVTKGAKEAYDPLCRMLRGGIQEGLTFKICSAYRSAERQKELFDEDVRTLTAMGMSYEQACEEVAKETQPPGYSEHATGLAFDIVSFDHQMLDEGQEETAENQWLREHCAEYGFILRYPKDKEEVTGIRYESWHFRYVGVEAAKEITERGITLEEYYQYKSINV